MCKFLCALLLFASGPALASNIMTADCPPIGERGYTLQVDNRLTYSLSEKFVDRKGAESAKENEQRLNLLIARVFLPGLLFRASIPYSQIAVNGVSRSDFGDVTLEGGLTRKWGPWRLRALLFAGVPVSRWDRSAGATNIGVNAWSFGPNFSVTRYLDGNNYDLDFWAQYAVNFTNPATRIKAGNVFSYAAAAGAKVPLGPHTRVAVEQRGLFGDPNEVRGSSAGQWGKTQLSAGPAMFISMEKLLPGFQLWPIAQFDFYNRNTQRTALYYLKLQYNW
ncbi:MAG: transporter [Elusimicrobiales bacterium]|nr:transporter [Elusimicrobiales bacterium]